VIASTLAPLYRSARQDLDPVCSAMLCSQTCPPRTQTPLKHYHGITRSPESDLPFTSSKVFPRFLHLFRPFLRLISSLPPRMRLASFFPCPPQFSDHPPPRIGRLQLLYFQCWTLYVRSESPQLHQLSEQPCPPPYGILFIVTGFTHLVPCVHFLSRHGPSSGTSPLSDAERGLSCKHPLWLSYLKPPMLLPARSRRVYF